MNKTNIEYLDYTWNPIAMRCTPVSEGCAHCWHLRMADRFTKNPLFSPASRAAYAGDGPPVVLTHKLSEPTQIHKPSIIGVQFMGDLFHRSINKTVVRDVFDMMVLAPQHTYVVLTKRPEHLQNRIPNFAFDRIPNLLLGVTVEYQKYWEHPYRKNFLDVPGVKHILSLEPLLGPIELGLHPGGVVYDAHQGIMANPIDWVIAGCESGKNRRHAKTDWFRSLRDQCQEARVPFFLKQMEVDGKVVHMPRLDGQIWREVPGS